METELPSSGLKLNHMRIAFSKYFLNKILILFVRETFFTTTVPDVEVLIVKTGESNKCLTLFKSYYSSSRAKKIEVYSPYYFPKMVHKYNFPQLLDLTSSVRIYEIKLNGGDCIAFATKKTQAWHANIVTM